LALAHPPLSREVRAAYLAPYDEDRRAVADFVADIPADPSHPSRPALDAIADGLARLDVPALVPGGPRDPVFLRRHAEGRLRRLPRAAVPDGVARVEVPALVLWGPRDPVFQRRYLEDLLRRLPHADVHRFEGAGHLLAEDVDVAGTVTRWLASTFPAPLPADSRTSPAG